MISKVPVQGYSECLQSKNYEIAKSPNEAFYNSSAMGSKCSNSRFASDKSDDYYRAECSADRNDSDTLVNGLMSSPKWPWRQSKGANLTSHSGFQNNKRLKHGSRSGTKKTKGRKLFEERRALKARSKRKKDSSNSVEASNESASYKVRETLHLFRDVYRKLTDENESTLRRGGEGRNRIDLDTQRILKEHGKTVNAREILGSVPGVNVGDEFRFRVELSVVGLHCPSRAGIDYMKQDGTVIAISIVASGGYDDEMGSADFLDYSGSGGNPPKGTKEFEDQKLVRENLALKNSIAAKNPVRVIRGYDHKVSGGKTFKTYTYDGLYIVTRYWPRWGTSGNLVYMFRLERIPGQPEISWNVNKKS